MKNSTKLWNKMMIKMSFKRFLFLIFAISLVIGSTILQNKSTINSKRVSIESEITRIRHMRIALKNSGMLTPLIDNAIKATINKLIKDLDNL